MREHRRQAQPPMQLSTEAVVANNTVVGTGDVRITLLGIRPTVRDVTIPAAAPQVALGTIQVARIAVALQGVSVEAERDAVTIEPDRNSYRSKDVAPAATNASEVLESVPSVQVDGEGKVNSGA